MLKQLRFSARENRAEEEGQPISTIFLLVVAPIKLVTMVTFIVFENRPPPKNRQRGMLKGVILGGLHKSISLHLFKPLIQVYIHITQVLCPFK